VDALAALSAAIVADGVREHDGYAKGLYDWLSKGVPGERRKAKR
jgi:hypothetical protein